MKVSERTKQACTWNMPKPHIIREDGMWCYIWRNGICNKAGKFCAKLNKALTKGK